MSPSTTTTRTVAIESIAQLPASTSNHFIMSTEAISTEVPLYIDAPIVSYEVATASANPFANASATANAPPPYTPESAAPEYSPPHTFAKDLFIFGFLFFPFWIVGALILNMKLRPAPEAECGKTAEEQAVQLAIIRQTEVVWAKRSLYALVTLLASISLLIGILAMAQVGIFARH